jgi:gluconolactonase
MSPDEKVLYINDSGYALGDGKSREVYAYDIGSVPGSVAPGLSNRRVLHTLTTEQQKIADGMKVDVEGNVWIGDGAGLSIVSPGGEVIGQIAIPGGATNMVFAGADYKTLVVLSETAIWALDLKVAGALQKRNRSRYT